ncbi:MAG: uroporphyrinogen-III synthase [Pseudomonadota bacterium]
MPRTELNGLTILVTRPEHQAEPLCRLIESAGGQALRLPVLTIHDSSNAPAVTEKLARLGDYDLVIFISPNAVHFGIAAMQRLGDLPAGLQLATVGRGSARTLSEHTGRSPDLVPDERFDSEGLLALEQLQQMAGKRVLIFRGNGGRELLADSLRQRGAVVDYAEVYHRDCPTVLSAGDERLNRADIIVITSSEGVSNLVSMTPSVQQQKLFASPLLLISERAIQRARELGFQGECLISPQATDEAIVNTLTNWAQQHPTTLTEK